MFLASKILYARRISTRDLVKVVGWSVAAVLATWLVVAAPIFDGSVLRNIPLATLLPVILVVGTRENTNIAAWAGFATSVGIEASAFTRMGLFANAWAEPRIAHLAQLMMVVAVWSVVGLALLFEERRQRERELIRTAHNRQILNTLSDRLRNGSSASKRFPHYGL